MIHMFSFPIKNQPNWWFFGNLGMVWDQKLQCPNSLETMGFSELAVLSNTRSRQNLEKIQTLSGSAGHFWFVSCVSKLGKDWPRWWRKRTWRSHAACQQAWTRRFWKKLQMLGFGDSWFSYWLMANPREIGNREEHVCFLNGAHCPRMHIFIHQQLEMKWRCTMSAPCRMVKNSIPRAPGVKPSPLHSVKVKWSLGGTWGWHPCAKVRWQNSPWRQSLPMAMQVGFGNARHVKPASSIFSELENLLRGFLDMLTHWVWCNPFIKWLKCQTSSFLANPILGLGVSTEHYWYHVLQVHLPKFPRKPRWSSRLSCWISSRRTTSLGMAGWWRLCRRRAVVGRCPRTRVNKGLGPPGSQQIFTFFTSQRRGCWIGFKHQLNFQIFFSCCWIGLQHPQKGWVFNPLKKGDDYKFIRYYKILQEKCETLKDFTENMQGRWMPPWRQGFLWLSDGFRGLGPLDKSSGESAAEHEEGGGMQTDLPEGFWWSFQDIPGWILSFQTVLFSMHSWKDNPQCAHKDTQLQWTSFDQGTPPTSILG